MTTQSPSSGMRAFLTIWFGQLVSLIGSQLTGFALGVLTAVVSALAFFVPLVRNVENDLPDHVAAAPVEAAIALKD